MIKKQRLEDEAKDIEKEKKAFLECVLKTAETEFENYERGYKFFSITFPQKSHFSLDDEILTTIVNALAYAYKCEFKSLSLTEIIYPKSYTFTFEK